jgi:hypothetical protein
MKIRLILGAIAMLTLSSAMLGCSGGAPSEEHARSLPEPLATTPSGQETLEKTGIARWEVYGSKRSDSRYHVLARGRNNEFKNAVRLDVSQTVKVTTHRPLLRFDARGNLLESTFTREQLEFATHLHRDLQERGEQAYGCAGDILWAVGGLIATVGSCAAVIPAAAAAPIEPAVVYTCVGTFVGGFAAGVVSAVEDCQISSDTNEHVNEEIDIENESFDEMFEDVSFERSGVCIDEMLFC